MNKKKKLSGCQFRDIRKTKAKEDKTYDGSISNLFKRKAQSNLELSHNRENSDEVFEDPINENVEEVNNEDIVVDDNNLNEETNKEDDVRNSGNNNEHVNDFEESLDAYVDRFDEQEMIDILNGHVEEVDKDIELNYDPGLWGDLNDNKRVRLVKRGPIKILKDFDEFPRKNDVNGRCFSCKHYVYYLNSEPKERRWLVYSNALDKVFCFCCKLFKDKTMKSKLANDGVNDWHNIIPKLKEHDVSRDHRMYMMKWIDLERGLRLNATVDISTQKQVKIEKSRWRLVLVRIISVVKVLSGNSMAFRGTNEKIYEKNNGLFCQLIECIAEFDVVMEEHLRRVMNNEINHHYLSHKIQNELIYILANEIKKIMLEKILKAKFYTVILDCTPDRSHVEQMSIIIRCVDVEGSKVKVEEFFLGFIEVKDTTGEGLFESLKKHLDDLKLDFMNIRGQCYDNGSNMKGKNKGVQNRVLQINPRAMYVPCGCHTLNLTLCDMSKTCSIARDFFGHLQKIYNLVLVSTQRWDITLKAVTQLTIKSLSQTRWESHIESVRAIKNQVTELRKALIQIANAAKNDDVGRAEAKGLVKNVLEDFGFLISLCVWYKILHKINRVSIFLQKEEMDLEMALKKINDLIDFFKQLRNEGFEELLEEAKQLAIKMSIDVCFPQKRNVKRPIRFDDEQEDELENLERVEKYRVSFFVYIIDQALTSLDERFKQYRFYEERFRFLFGEKLKITSDEDLLSYCTKLEDFLKHDDHCDVNGNDLYSEIRELRVILPKEVTKAIDILDFIKSYSDGGLFFGNASISYRILLTIPVSVASAERSFSKLKLIKNYLRTIMSQERLNGLSMIAIEKELLHTLKFDNIIEEFASNNASRDRFN